MRRSILAAFLAAAFAAVAPSLVTTNCLAGQNAGGALLFHANPRLTYTSDVGNYAGLSGEPECGNIVSRHDGSDPVVIHLLAVFAPEAHPCVRGVEFGIDYDADKITIVDSGRCGDLEIPSPNWPAPGTGTAVTFQALSGAVNEVYWFVAYASADEPAELRVTSSPRQGGTPAQFGDCAMMADLDDVELLGSFGFNQDGSAPCPTAVQTVGACCYAYECHLMTAEACAARRGEYRGDGTECDPDFCPPWVEPHCCMQGECSQLSEAECTSAGGTYLAERCEWQTCSVGPRGACCREGRCFVTTGERCEGMGGTYLGDESICAASICPTAPTGACCLSLRGCWEATIEHCTSAGGEYHGDGSTCDPDPCPPVEPRVGACCVERFDFCVLRSEAQCTGETGTFLGLGSDCDPDPCPQHAGACCLRSGECMQVGGAECNSLRGEYRGPDTSCDPNPCAPAERGACCTPDGACFVLDAFSCAQRGRFLGAGTVCDPSPCSADDHLPGQRSTWGGIKDRYR